MICIKYNQTAKNTSMFWEIRFWAARQDKNKIQIKFEIKIKYNDELY